MKKFVFLVVLISSGYALGDVKLPGILSNHAVLQRDMKVRIWGWAEPGEKVTVQFRKQQIETQADAKGDWAVMLKPMKAGGPDDLTVTGKNTVSLKDILVGEVWVCSGQSNMEWPVCFSANPQEEIAAANHPQIRLFSVNQRVLGNPANDTYGQWQLCRPKTVGGFSAVGYYFARFLNRELKVPVGVFDSTWGGTPAEAWTPLAALKAKKLNSGLVAQYEKSLLEQAEACRTYEAKLAKHDQLLKEGKLPERHPDPGNKGLSLGWANADFKDADWKTAELPRTVDDLLDGDGAIWVRRRVTLPAEWTGHNLRLHLGTIDDYDVTYWNGVQIGETNMKTNPADWWACERKYAIPGKLVTAGPVVLAVRVFDDFMGGGVMGPPEGMYLEDTTTGKRIPLAGTWSWKVEVTMDPTMLASISTNSGPYNPSAPGTLYNGMIHPLTSYALRGAIWYQGESNAGAYQEYVPLLSTMIEEWRRAWGNPDMAFGIVQLANFLAIQPDPNAGSAWAGLREAQTKVSQTLPGTGLAVAIDIGDAGNIHPKNKQDVGKRLGLWALAKVYGKWIEYSGPMYKSMKITGNKIQINFSHVGWGGLVVKGDNKLTGFAIAGADGKYVWAEAKIEGSKVIVWSDKVPQPVAVRYAWADNPVCNLYNKADLPAGPFRTDPGQ